MFRDGTDRQTDTHNHGHGDSMTNSAQWGRVGENILMEAFDNTLITKEELEAMDPEGKHFQSFI